MPIILEGNGTHISDPTLSKWDYIAAIKSKKPEIIDRFLIF
tara:strand:+ start:25559 stop:25681 length:123 start_codon:yes stop_codon:yes gene_type:complete